MKKNILVQTGTRTEQRIVTSYDEDGNPIEEVINVEVPIMESQYVDITDEEIADLPQEEPTHEERLSAIEDVLLEMMGCRL